MLGSYPNLSVPEIHPLKHLRNSHKKHITPTSSIYLSYPFTSVYINIYLAYQCLPASRLEFESRKDVVHIFNNLLRRQIGSRWPTVEYLCKRGDVVFETLKGYENEDIALNTGMILKEMLRHESLCKLLLWSDQYVFS